MISSSQREPDKTMLWAKSMGQNAAEELAKTGVLTIKGFWQDSLGWKRCSLAELPIKSYTGQ
jgi:hypothetical protein